MESTHFVVRRDRLTEHEVVMAPRAVLAPGEAELRIDMFGFTTNNVTYGLRGDSMSFWKFFPESRSGWGRIPVWGFGTVVQSLAEGVSVGERFYGYFPMSSHLVVQPRRIEAAGFFDGAPHRRDLSALYNHYVRTTRDPSYHPDTEAPQVLLRPLYGTAFFLADWLREYQFFDAEIAVMSSASSKLACSAAYVMAPDARRERRKIIGLTSAHNAAYVTGLKLYDRVVTYDDIAALPTGKRTVYIDIAGSTAVRAAVHRHLGSALRQSILVGSTHHDTQPDQGLPGPEPMPFFAPTWITQRNHQWTPEGVRKKLGESWRGFLTAMLAPARGWMSIAQGTGPTEVGRTFDVVVGGRAPPDKGHVLSM